MSKGIYKIFKTKKEFDDFTGNLLDMGEEFGIQQIMDTAMLALHYEFGFGRDRLIRFYDAVGDQYKRINGLLKSDRADDPDAVYAKAKFDAELAYLLGDRFEPYEVRYPNCK